MGRSPQWSRCGAPAAWAPDGPSPACCNTKGRASAPGTRSCSRPPRRDWDEKDSNDVPQQVERPFPALGAGLAFQLARVDRANLGSGFGAACRPQLHSLSVPPKLHAPTISKTLSVLDRRLQRGHRQVDRIRKVIARRQETESELDHCVPQVALVLVHRAGLAGGIEQHSKSVELARPGTRLTAVAGNCSPATEMNM